MKCVKFNINPSGLEFGDCTVRAIAKGLGKDWLTVYDDLYKLGRTIHCMPNDNETIKLYLDTFETNTCKAIKGEKRKAVKDFDKGTYILKIANHYTVVIDNVNYDLWDCRKRSVYRYWKINNKEVSE
jgi:hypothetical protein